VEILGNRWTFEKSGGNPWNSMKTQGNSMEIHIDGRTLYDVAGRHDLVKDQILRASHEANV